MPFIFLLLFALICLQTSWPQPPWWLTEEGCAILVVTMMVTSWLLAELIARTISWQMSRQPERRSTLLRRYAGWRRQHFIGLLIVYFVLLYFLGWGHVWKNWLTGLLGSDRGAPPGFEVGLMAPFFIGLVLSWERFYHVEKAAYTLGNDVQDRFISKRAYLLLQIRHQLLLVMPPIMLLLLQQALFAFFPGWNEESYLAAIVATVMMAGTFLLMPLLLRIFLGLKPMPPCPLRTRLEETARRLRFGYSNILVWHTRHQFANALVTGFIPWMRYIVLTDRLIDDLTPEETEAVFAHEIGHIKHHHLLFYLAFFLASFILLGLFWDYVREWIKQDEIMAALQRLPFVSEDVKEVKDTLKTISSFGKLGLLAVYTLLFFGFLSRRCERQADLFGSQTVSIDAFINALEKVAVINGIPRDRAGNWLLSWQHPTIAQRVDFLEKMRDHPTLIPRFQRSIMLLQGAFYVLLGFLLWQFELPKLWKLLAEF